MEKSIKILVTGGGGQLAQCLKKIAPKDQLIQFVTKTELDIQDKNAIEDYLQIHQPDVVINTAAYTQVDAAESDQETTYAINAEAVKNLALSCKKYSCKLIHVSTDYVFDGSATTPYIETDKPNPVTAYGKSKLAGENHILQSGLCEFAIIRTSWLYSNFGHNFYKTMLRLAETRNELSVVNDQRGCPTYAVHLAGALLQIANILTPETTGIYHYSNTGIATWFDFATAIFKEKKLPITVHPISTSSFPTPAKRPSYSVLDNGKIQDTFNLTIPTWQQGLRDCLSED